MCETTESINMHELISRRVNILNRRRCACGSAITADGQPRSFSVAFIYVLYTALATAADANTAAADDDDGGGGGHFDGETFENRVCII